MHTNQQKNTKKKKQKSMKKKKKQNETSLYNVSFNFFFRNAEFRSQLFEQFPIKTREERLPSIEIIKGQQQKRGITVLQFCNLAI